MAPPPPPPRRGPVAPPPIRKQNRQPNNSPAIPIVPSDQFQEESDPSKNEPKLSE